MTDFEIVRNEYLGTDIPSFYHDVHIYWNNTKVRYINTLKNDPGTFSDNVKDFGYTLLEARSKLNSVLDVDLRVIQEKFGTKLTVCVLPRAKRESQYKSNQLYFKETVRDYVINNSDIFDDGIDFIMRNIDTETTHNSSKKILKVGLTKDTCTISSLVKGKDILLIDDVYTKGVNIVEDAIQALLDFGANSVIFYSIGCSNL
jgi:phosphoribosylpyrophosphate synthetase